MTKTKRTSTRKKTQGRKAKNPIQSQQLKHSDETDIHEDQVDASESQKVRIFITCI